MIEIRFSGIRRGGPMCPPDWIEKIIVKTLRVEKASDWQMGVLITDNKEIQRLNKKFLNHDCATDVIAFNLGPRLGDIVVSAQMAKTVARQLNISFREELARYLVHGTLHVLGYRDKTVKDRKKMWERQERILSEA